MASGTWWWHPGIVLLILWACAHSLPYQCGNQVTRYARQGANFIYDDSVNPRFAFPVASVLPTVACTLGALTLKCPGSAASLLAKLYGGAWRVPVDRDRYT